MIRIIILLTLCLPAHAAMYKWVDDDGQVHYSDKRIEEHAETIDIEDTYTGSTGLRAGEKKWLRRIEREQHRRPPAAGKQRKTAKRRDRRECKFYQEEIDDIKEELRRGYSVRRGEHLKARLQRSRARIKELCK